MLYKCANESCNAPFRRLREGKLFQVETEFFSGHDASSHAARKGRPTRRVEHYWLCDACSPFVTLSFDRARGVITVPLPDGLGEKNREDAVHGRGGDGCGGIRAGPKNPH